MKQMCHVIIIIFIIIIFIIINIIFFYGVVPVKNFRWSQIYKHDNH